MLRTAYRWVEGAKDRETRQEAEQHDGGINSVGVIATTTMIIIIFITCMAKHQAIRTESTNNWISCTGNRGHRSGGRMLRPEQGWWQLRRGGARYKKQNQEDLVTDWSLVLGRRRRQRFCCQNRVKANVIEMGNREGLRSSGKMNVKQWWYSEAEVLKKMTIVAAANNIFLISEVFC